MTFATSVARVLAPVAIIAAAVPVAAADNAADLARVQQHIRAVDTMTANFVQTDSKKRSIGGTLQLKRPGRCLLYTSPSPRDRQKSRMPSSA